MYQILEPQLFDKSFSCKRNIQNYDYLDIRKFIEIFFKKHILCVDKDSKIIKSGVIGLVSKFGSGKSFFSQYLFCYIKNNYNKDNKVKNKIYPIYIDISKLENNKEHLLMLITVQIGYFLKKAKVKSSIFNISKKLLPISAKIATSIFLKKINNIEELIITGAGEISEGLTNYLIESIDQDNLYVKNLQDLANKAPLVIIIDNLDRCRPEFVLNFFSLTKQLFTVDNVLFILPYDKQQIINLLETLYSDKVDISSYLHKYISYEVYLPQYKDLYEFTREYCKIKHNKSKMNNIDRDVNKLEISETIAIKIWIEVFGVTNMSLRQFQHGLDLIIKLYRKDKEDDIKEDYKIKIVEMILLIFLKILYPYLYQSLYYYFLWIDDENIEEIDRLELESIEQKITKNKINYKKDIEQTIIVLQTFLDQLHSQEISYKDKYCISDIYEKRKPIEIKEKFKYLEFIQLEDEDS